MHARWFSYLQRFNFTIKHKQGQSNKVADALSRRTSLLTIMRTTITAFDAIKDSYEMDEDFSEVWKKCKTGEQVPRFKVENGFSFKENRSCIPKTSLMTQLIQETHSGGLIGYFGRDKVVAQLDSRFFGPL